MLLLWFRMHILFIMCRIVALVILLFIGTAIKVVLVFGSAATALRCMGIGTYIAGVVVLVLRFHGYRFSNITATNSVPPGNKSQTHHSTLIAIGAGNETIPLPDIAFACDI